MNLTQTKIINRLFGFYAIEIVVSHASISFNLLIFRCCQSPPYSLSLPHTNNRNVVLDHVVNISEVWVTCLHAMECNQLSKLNTLFIIFIFILCAFKWRFRWLCSSLRWYFCLVVAFPPTFCVWFFSICYIFFSPADAVLFCDIQIQLTNMY